MDNTQIMQITRALVADLEAQPLTKAPLAHGGYDLNVRKMLLTLIPIFLKLIAAKKISSTDLYNIGKAIRDNLVRIEDNARCVYLHAAKLSANKPEETAWFTFDMIKHDIESTPCLHRITKDEDFRCRFFNEDQCTLSDRNLQILLDYLCTESVLIKKETSYSIP